MQSKVVSVEALARRRQYSRALEFLSSAPSVSSHHYKSFFQGLLDCGSRGASVHAQEALDKMRTLHRLTLDSATAEVVISVFRNCRDVDSLMKLLATLNASTLTPQATSLALESLSLADRLSHREFQTAWTLIGNFVSFSEKDAISALRLCRRGRWSFSRLTQLMQLAPPTSISVAREAMRCMAVCPDLASAEAVQLAFRKFLDFRENSDLVAAMVEVYVRRGFLDHAISLASETPLTAASTGASPWDPLVVAAAHLDDPNLVTCLWQNYEPRVARPAILIDSLAKTSVRLRSAAAAVAALTEALTRSASGSEKFPITPAVLSELRQLADLTTNVRLREKLVKLIEQVPAEAWASA